jgi:uncharacterized protein (TIGR04141 family)
LTDEQTKIGLTIFLVKPDQVDGFERKHLNSGGVPLAAPFDGFFVPLTSRGQEPSWVDEIRAIVAGGLPPMHSQSPAGLLVVRRSGRTFVITFGHAWQRLQDQWLERDFGRRVALNTISPAKLVAIHVEQVFAKWHLANERAPRAASIREFGVRFDRDLVGVIEGVPAHSSLGAMVRGGINLRVKVPVADLNDILDETLTLFASDAYKKVWPEVDNLTPVRNELLRARLDAQFDAELAAGIAQKKLVMFTPVSRREEAIIVDSYVYGRMTKSPAVRPYLSVGSWLSFLQERGKTPSTQEARNSPVHLLDDGKEEIKSCTAYDCFGYEMALDGKQFVLSSGIWYEVVPSFLSRINATVRHIAAPTRSLPAWNQVDGEGEYNRRCAQKESLLHFDAKNVRFGGGQSQFEFCDLLDMKSKTLFFAKIASKSSGMSHLVEQVRRTAELLFSADPGYRKDLAKVFRAHHPQVDRRWLDARPKNGDWQLALVSLGRPADKLPFFAKCGLARLYHDLSEGGQDVRFLAV